MESSLWSFSGTIFFFELAMQANQKAALLREGISEAGFEFLTDSPINQIFPIFPNALIAELEKKYAFLVWEKVDGGHSAIRLVTSWAAKEDMVRAFIADVKTNRVPGKA